MITELLPDSLPLLGDDPIIMKELKYHLGLPLQETWTEGDGNLKSFLDAAEKSVDKLCGYNSYRPRQLQVSLTGLQCFHRSYSRLKGIKLVNGPIASSPAIQIAWTSSDGSTGTYTLADFAVYGRLTLTPEILFPPTFSENSIAGVPYPYIVIFTTLGNLNPVAKTAIFELAAHYFRFPEAATDGQVPLLPIFQSNLDFLKPSML